MPIFSTSSAISLVRNSACACHCKCKPLHFCIFQSSRFTRVLLWSCVKICEWGVLASVLYPKSHLRLDVQGGSISLHGYHGYGWFDPVSMTREDAVHMKMLSTINGLAELQRRWQSYGASYQPTDTQEPIQLLPRSVIVCRSQNFQVIPWPRWKENAASPECCTIAFIKQFLAINLLHYHRVQHPQMQYLTTSPDDTITSNNPVNRSTVRTLHFLQTIFFKPPTTSK